MPTAPENIARDLGHIRLLAGLSPERLGEIAAHCEWLNFRRDEPIIQRGEQSTKVYFIVKGGVRVMNYLAEDREVTFAELTAGDHFGELSAIDGQERSTTVLGGDDCVLAALSREDFLSLLPAMPESALRLLSRFAGIIRGMDRRVAALMTLSPRQRVYVELMRLAAPNPKGDGSWIIEITPTHNEIASWAGTEKQEVALAIGSLAREGIVERKSMSLLIKDLPRLRTLANL